MELKSISLGLVVFVTAVSMAAVFQAPSERFSVSHYKVKRCCGDFKTHRTGMKNCIRWKKVFEEELNSMPFPRGFSFKYADKLWKSMSAVGEKLEEKREGSTRDWMVNASKLDRSSDKTMMLPGRSVLSSSNKLTRLELVVPYYHLIHLTCKPKRRHHVDSFIKINGTKISSTAGTVPFKNLLVFQLPVTREFLDIDNHPVTIISDTQVIALHLHHAMIVKYYNMDPSVLSNINNDARWRVKSIISIEITSLPNNKQSNRRLQELYLEGGQERVGQEIKNRRRRSILDPVPSCTSCKLSDYSIRTEDQISMRESIVNPPVINVKRCSGECDTLQFDDTGPSLSTRSVLLNLMTNVMEGQEVLKSSCVPHKMIPIILFKFMKDSHTISMNSYPNGQIKSCRCV